MLKPSVVLWVMDTSSAAHRRSPAAAAYADRASLSAISGTLAVVIADQSKAFGRASLAWLAQAVYPGHATRVRVASVATPQATSAFAGSRWRCARRAGGPWTWWRAMAARSSR